MSSRHKHGDLVFPAGGQRDAMYFCAKCGMTHAAVYQGCDGLRESTPHGVPLDPLKPASERQVGGDHYTKLKIQPMRYSLANGLDAAQHTIIKYVTRFRDKGGLADLQKARRTLDLLIEYETEASRDR